MSVLNEICAKKKDHIDTQKSKISFYDLKLKAQENLTKQIFRKAILAKALNNKVALIAEVKKASPSHGVIRKNFAPVSIATAYKTAGATCLSVLTDTPYFQGDDSCFKQIRSKVDLPMLRKDFMIDPYQIYESRVLGANCVLLIMAAITDMQAQEMAGIASELGMDVLCEIHDEEELTRAADMKFDMIGINNRDLKTLDVSLQRGLDMVSMLPPDTLKIAESGIHTHDQIQMYMDRGFHGFLVGESLMRKDDIEEATRALLGQNLQI